MNFLFDANMPPGHWVAGIASLSHARFEENQVGVVLTLSSKFRRNTPDVEWLEALGQERGKWTIISQDAFRKRNGAERELLRRHNLSVFVLQSSWASRPYWEKTAQFVHWWPRIVHQACTTERVALEVPWNTSGKFRQI